MFNAEYYSQVYAFINKQDNAHFKISDLTANPEKLIFHLRYYIANRKEEDLIIDLLDSSGVSSAIDQDITQLVVPELFESKIKEREDLIRKIVETFDLVEIKNNYEAQQATTIYKGTTPYVPPGLFS